MIDFSEDDILALRLAEAMRACAAEMGNVVGNQKSDAVHSCNCLEISGNGPVQPRKIAYPPSAYAG